MCIFKSIENYQNGFQGLSDILHWDIAWTTEEKELQGSYFNPVFGTERGSLWSLSAFQKVVSVQISH